MNYLKVHVITYSGCKEAFIGILFIVGVGVVYKICVLNLCVKEKRQLKYSCYSVRKKKSVAF